MDSVLCLHHGSLRIPSTTSCAARLARPYSSFRPSSISLVSKASTYRTLAQHSFTSPLICALNSPSPRSPNNDKDNGKHIVKMVGCASVVLACALGVINCHYNFNTTAIAREKGSRTTASLTQREEPVMSNPKDVLDTVLKLNRPLPTQKVTGWRKKPKLEEIPKTLTHPEEDLNKLKTAVAGFIKAGKLDEAERKLEALYEWTRGGELGYEVEMELVLVRIFQEKYNDALKCTCLGNVTGIPSDGPSDGRVPFYKAIIHTMIGENLDVAETCWIEFITSFRPTQDRLKHLYEVDHPKLGPRITR